MIKVLTLREPWASLILHGYKPIETRSWHTSYRGELYIHSGKYPMSKRNERVAKLIENIPLPDALHGHIILKCALSDCVFIDDHFAYSIQISDPLNFLCGDFSVGRYAWILTNVQPIEPISATGHLGLWNYDLNQKEAE